MSPSPTQRHRQIIHALVTRIAAMLPTGVEVISGWGWRVGKDEFIPDVMVYDATDDQLSLASTPHLVVAVLSTDRSADTIRKFHKYATAGLERYWLIDPDGPVVVIYRLEDGAYRLEARLEARSPSELDRACDNPPRPCRTHRLTCRWGQRVGAVDPAQLQRWPGSSAVRARAAASGLTR